jgi:hypothetical protein
VTAAVDAGLAHYVYGVVRSDLEIPPDLVGLDDQPVTLVPTGELAVLVSPVQADRAVARRDDLLAHSRVLNAVVIAGEVVPVRFGAILSGAADPAAEVVGPRADYLKSVLDELAGRTQMTLHARYEEQQVLAEIVAESPEIAALRDRTRDAPEDTMLPERVRLGELVMHAMEAKRGSDGPRIVAALLPHAAASNVRQSAGTDQLIDVAFLVDDKQREPFEQAAEDVAEQFAGRARIKLVGPTAPYDFVTDLE